MSNKYDGYEELLTAKPDPTFVEPKGMSGLGTSSQPRAGHARPRLMLTPCECLPGGSITLPFAEPSLLWVMGFFQRLPGLAQSAWVENCS